MSDTDAPLSPWLLGVGRGVADMGGSAGTAASARARLVLVVATLVGALVTLVTAAPAAAAMSSDLFIASITYDGPSSVAPGDPLTLVANVANAGPNLTLNEAMVTFTVPDDVFIVGRDGCQVDGRTATCVHSAQISPGSTAPVRLPVILDLDPDDPALPAIVGPVTVQVSSLDPDPRPWSNELSTYVGVLTDADHIADLRVTHSWGPDGILPDGVSTLSVTVENVPGATEHIATDVFIAPAFAPLEAEIIGSADTDVPPCEALPCELGDLGPDESATRSFRVRFAPDISSVTVLDYVFSSTRILNDADKQGRATTWPVGVDPEEPGTTFSGLVTRPDFPGVAGNTAIAACPMPFESDGAGYCVGMVLGDIDPPAPEYSIHLTPGEWQLAAILETGEASGPLVGTAVNVTASDELNTVPLDLAAPDHILVTTPVEGATYPLGAHVPSQVACRSISSCVHPGVVDTSTAGPHQFTVNATDLGGVDGSQTISYTVAEAPTSRTLSGRVTVGGVGRPGSGVAICPFNGVQACPDGSPPLIVLADPAGDWSQAVSPNAQYIVTAFEAEGLRSTDSVPQRFRHVPTDPTGAAVGELDIDIQLVGERLTGTVRRPEFDALAPGTGVGACPLPFVPGPNVCVGQRSVLASTVDGSYALRLPPDPDGWLVAAFMRDAGALVPGPQVVVMIASGAGADRPHDALLPDQIDIIRPADGETFSLGQVVTPHGLCYFGVACTPPATIDTSTPGQHTFTVTALDAAGIAGRDSVTYTVLAGNAAEEVVGGDTVTTDPGGVGASPDVPVQTEVSVPEGVSGTLAITPQDTVTNDPSGFALFTQEIVLAGPAATADQPYEVSFTVDASALGGIAVEDIAVFRNGVEVGDCEHDAHAVPDPCVVARVAADGGDAVVRVRTSQFSTWSLGAVDYDVTGAGAPVAAFPASNGVKAGSTVPVKFGLGGDRGLDVLAAGFPALRACDATTGGEVLSAARLSYDPVADRYTYSFKTTAAMHGCRDLVLRFRDGSELAARFTIR